MAAQILLVEDDASLQASLRKVLIAEGYEVDAAARGDEGLKRGIDKNYDVVITDLKLPGIDGLELVRRLHNAKPKLPIIMMTAHGTTETAIEATKLGHGGITYISQLLGCDAKTIQHGKSEIENPPTQEDLRRQRKHSAP